VWFPQDPYQWVCPDVVPAEEALFIYEAHVGMAQEEGKVRHIGFSGHKEPKVNLHMHKLLQRRGIKVEASQFPVNVCDPDYASFIKEVIPVCLKQKIGILAMKTMCGGRMFGGTGEGWGPRGKVSTDPVIPAHLSFRDATDYVWELPIATRIAGFDNLEQLSENIEAARSAEELSDKRRAEILKIAAEHSGPNREYYKRNLFDQDNPREKRF
jgi:aryl-alcohol dehydrogenase-like predicted oxidoreductase